MIAPDVSSDRTAPDMALCDEAFALMEQALVLLDQAGLSEAALRLDHAICLIPDACGTIPRLRSIKEVIL